MNFINLLIARLNWKLLLPWLIVVIGGAFAAVPKMLDPNASLGMVLVLWSIGASIICFPVLAYLFWVAAESVKDQPSPAPEADYERTRMSLALGRLGAGAGKGTSASKILS